MTTIGRYEIREAVGEGGFGQVYRAFDPTVRRPVAIKVLFLSGDAQMINRFQIEAIAAGNLNHPNIVTIHDFGQADGRPYLVMEYLEGENLQQAITRGADFPLAEKAGIMSQVADGLECAHRHGVMHRDIKPANIMLLRDGGVKLMDFGIARLTGANTSQTKTGFVMGTVPFMSPEQFQDVELDARVDIWAYGVIYYQFLTGRHPFKAADEMGTMFNIVNTAPPSIRSIVKEVPEALAQIVERCLVKDRDLRYRSMEDLRFDALPVLRDLQRDHAARVLGEARKLMAQGQLDSAQTYVRKVLALDAGDRTAQQLHRAISEEIEHRAVRGRIEGLLKSADEALARHDPAKATEILHSVLRIDANVTEAHARLEYARNMQERAQHAAHLLENARTELGRDNLTAAWRNASEAVKADPQSAEGAELLQRIEQQIDSRDQQRKMSEGIAKARSLVGSGQHAEALALLATLGESEEIAALTREAEAGRKQQMRRDRLSLGIQAARQLIQQAQFDAARQRLEELAQEFTGEKAIGDLLTFAGAERIRLQRSEAIEKIRRDAAALFESGHLEASLEMANSGLATFPGDPGLLRLAENAASGIAERDRRAAVAGLLSAVDRLRAAGRFVEAQEKLLEALHSHGADPDLNRMLRQIQSDVEQRQRAESVNQAISHARVLIDNGAYQKALDLLDSARGFFPGELGIEVLAREATRLRDEADRQKQEQEALARAETALAAQKQQEQAALSQAESLARGGHLEEALGVIEQLLRDQPSSAAAPSIRDALQKKVDAERRAKAAEASIAALVPRIEAQIAKAEFVKAEALLEEGERIDPAHRELARLRREMAAERGFRHNLTAARAALKRKALEEAESYLRHAMDAKPGDPATEAVLEQLITEQKRERTRGEQKRERTRGEQKRERTREEQKRERIREEPKPTRPAGTKYFVLAGCAVAVAAISFGLWRYTHPVVQEQAHKQDPPVVKTEPVTPTIDKRSLDFTAKSGEADTAPQQFVIQGAGMSFRADAGADWIHITPTSGQLPATISVSARAAGLGPGDHGGSIRVAAGTFAESVAVVLHIEAPPDKSDKPLVVPLSIGTQSLTFRYQKDANDPRSQTVAVTGPAGAIRAAVRPGAAWLRASMRAQNSLEVSVAPETLKPDDYTGQVVVSAGQEQKTLIVRLTVLAPPVKKIVDTQPTGATGPVVKPVPCQPRDAEGPVDSAPYQGARRGSVTWSGRLEPGGCVLIGTGGVLEGGGAVTGALFPRGQPIGITITYPPQGVRIETAPSEANQFGRVSFVNTSAAPIPVIRFSWQIK